MKKSKFILCAFFAASIFFGLKQFNSLAKGQSSDAVESKIDALRKARQTCADSVQASVQHDFKGLSEKILYQDCMLRKGYFLIDKQSLNHVQ